MGPLSPPLVRFVGQRNGTLSQGWVTVPETTLESLVNKCLFDSDKRTQVWKKSRTAAPDLEENCCENTKVTLRIQLEQCGSELTFWNELALRKDEEIMDLKVQLEEVRGELQHLENLKVLQTEKWRKEAKTLALQLKRMNRETEALRRNS